LTALGYLFKSSADSEEFQRKLEEFRAAALKNISKESGRIGNLPPLD
jgi:hypothetical protein